MSKPKLVRLSLLLSGAFVDWSLLVRLSEQSERSLGQV